MVITIKNHKDEASALRALENNEATLIEVENEKGGFMTADPAMVKDSFLIKNLTYDEAIEMTSLDSEIVHPIIIKKAQEKHVPIQIVYQNNPETKGTLISNGIDREDYMIKGVSLINDLALLRISGSGLFGADYITARLFNILAKEKVNIVMIAQASSEYSICLAVETKNAERAKKIITAEFTAEINKGLFEKVVAETGLAIISMVGEKMRKTPGISGRLFQALGRDGINVVAVAQGSSEMNVSIVIGEADGAKALNVVHNAFFLSKYKAVHVFLIGTGLIGSTLLKQIDEQNEYLKRKHQLDIKVAGLARSDKMSFAPDGINLAAWEETLSNSNQASNLEKFIKTMREMNCPHSIFVDCTASEAIANKYEEILNANIPIATPNKKANSNNYQAFEKLKDISSLRNIKFNYETNVGAGLPIISTLNDLIASGDKIKKIEAVLSGTLSYIFNNFQGDKKFSQVVREAQAKGYTEPDPRDDLNGMDVARKLLILARLSGLKFEMNDINLQCIINEECQNAESIEDFYQVLEKLDAEFEQQKIKAAENQGKLCYIAKLEDGKAAINLEVVGPNHPFYSLSGSDNIISFTTKRYCETPLVVKGPGAGKEVTAAGVYADIIKVFTS